MCEFVKHCHPKKQRFFCNKTILGYSSKQKQHFSSINIYFFIPQANTKSGISLASPTIVIEIKIVCNYTAHMSDRAGGSRQQATGQDRHTSSVKRHTAVTMSWLIAGHNFGDNSLTFDVLCMTWIGINGQRCFVRRFLAVACIVTIVFDF